MCHLGAEEWILSWILVRKSFRRYGEWQLRVALTKLRLREGGAGAERAILLYVGHLQLISTLKIGADYCQLFQYKLTKPNLT